MLFPFDCPWMIFALKESGTHEIAGRGCNAEIAKFLASVHQSANDETPWCSAFVNWCVTQAGLKGTGKPNARSWLDWGRPLLTPWPGAITVFRRGTSSWKGHVAFYVGQVGKTIKVLGGNQNNRVQISSYPSDRLLGYRWPAGV